MYSAWIGGSTLSFLSAFQCFVFFSRWRMSLASPARLIFSTFVSYWLSLLTVSFFSEIKLFEVGGASWNAVPIFLEVLAIRVFFRESALSGHLRGRCCTHMTDVPAPVMRFCVQLLLERGATTDSRTPSRGRSRGKPGNSMSGKDYYRGRQAHGDVEGSAARLLGRQQNQRRKQWMGL